MSSTRIGRNYPEKPKDPTPIEVKDSLFLVISETLPKRRVTAKEIAREVNASPDTVEGWRDGTRAPSAYHLIILARKYPEIRAAVRLLMKLEDEADPEFTKLQCRIEMFLARRA